MKKLGIIIIAALTIACHNSKKWEQTTHNSGHQLSNYERSVLHYQDSMNLSFTTGTNQVLLKEDLEAGAQLAFYPVDESLRLKAKYEPIVNGKVFEMKTSTDRLPMYRDFGILHFVIGEDSLSLHLYQNLEYPDYLFCPFKDATNGEGSYGAGRYLDFSMSDTLEPIIDFNLSYNPLCAYNHKYSCPIPPAENHLPIAIKAGVKKWKH